MSVYSDLFRDVPSRCLTLYDQFRDPASGLETEVTLLLSVATLAFVLPYERLAAKPHARRSPHYRQPHNDAKEYPDAYETLNALLELPFVRTPLFEAVRKEAVAYGTTGFTTQDPREWTKLNEPGTPIEKAGLTTRDVVEVIRNGFAHGNVLTRPHSYRISHVPEVEEIVFIRGGRLITGGNASRLKPDEERREDYKFVRISPAGFEHLFRAWCAELKALRVPSRQPAGLELEVLETV